MALPDTYILIPGEKGPVKVRVVDSGDGQTYSLPIFVGGSGSAASQVQGTAANGAAVAGNPLVVAGVDGSGNVQHLNAITPADGDALAIALRVAALGRLYNGATVDLARGNSDLTVLASAARVASNNSADFTNYNHRGAVFFFNITAVPGVDTVQFTVEGKDPVSGSYKSLYAATAVATTGLLAYAIYPGAAGGTGSGFTAALQAILPRIWRARIVHSAGTSFTYSLGASLIL